MAIMRPLRKCDCGEEPEVIHSFSHMFVECLNCGATGKVFPVVSKYRGLWAREAAERAWNDRMMEEET